MALEDEFFKRHIPPDDIDDIREFRLALEKKVPMEKTQRMVFDFVNLSLAVREVLEEFKEVDDPIPTYVFDVSFLVSFYRFLKRNEHCVKSLYRIEREGEPFLHDLNYN